MKLPQIVLITDARCEGDLHDQYEGCLAILHAVDEVRTALIVASGPNAGDYWTYPDDVLPIYETHVADRLMEA